MSGQPCDPGTECVSVAGGLNRILNVLLATVEPGQEVVIWDAASTPPSAEALIAFG